MTTYNYRGAPVSACRLAGVCDDGLHFVGPSRRPGQPCQDCGRKVPVRVISFHSTGLRYTVCAGCEPSYVHLSRPVGDGPFRPHPHRPTGDGIVTVPGGCRDCGLTSSAGRHVAQAQ